jgi:hypothetical protein
MKKILFLAVAILITAVQVSLVKADQPDNKVTICHATGSADNQYVRTVVNEHATGGHFDNNGTPLDGHEDDILLQGEQDCPGTVTPPDPTPTPDPDPDPTPTPDPDPQPTPDPDPIPTPTPTQDGGSSRSGGSSGGSRVVPTPTGSVLGEFSGLAYQTPEVLAAETKSLPVTGFPVSGLVTLIGLVGLAALPILRKS